MDTIDAMTTQPKPTADRPLLGQTLLVVEDSLYACEALRLMALRSGARLRRADSLATARKHLAVYRPSVIIVDVGLPDGSGLPLIGALAGTSPRIDVILGTSADDTAAPAVMGAGADGFLAKPVDSLGAFQQAILTHLPAGQRPPGLRSVARDRIAPDRIALHDDLEQVAAALRADPGEGEVEYLARFVEGIARSVPDPDLQGAARALRRARASGEPFSPEIARLSLVVGDRLATRKPV